MPKRILIRVGQVFKRSQFGLIVAFIAAFTVAIFAWVLSVAKLDLPTFVALLFAFIVATIILAILVQLVMLSVGAFFVWLGKLRQPHTIGLEIQSLTQDTGKTALTVPTFGTGQRAAFRVTNNSASQLAGCYATLEGCWGTSLEDISKGNWNKGIPALPSVWNGKKLLWSNPATSIGTLDVASRTTEILYPIEVSNRHFCFLFYGNADQPECDSDDRGLPAGWYVFTIKVHGELDGESITLNRNFVAQLQTMPTVRAKPDMDLAAALAQQQIESMLHLCEYDEFIERQKPDWNKTSKGKAEALAREEFSQGLQKAARQLLNNHREF